jgi:hypothetical protein
VIPGTIRSAGPDWRQLTTVVMVIDRIRVMDLLGRAERDHGDIEWAADTESALKFVLRAAEL